MMDTKRKDTVDPMPDWFEDELKKTPVPDEATLSRYDYMKDDFIAAVQRAAAVKKKVVQPETTPVEAVFSMAGKLIEAVENIMTDMLPAPGMAAPGLARSATRGKDEGKENAPSQASGKIIGRIAKNIERECLEITTIKDQGDLKIEVNVLDRETGMEKRPFRLYVQDTEAKDLIAPVDVRVGDMPPKLPKPGPGVYIFKTTWNDGAGSVRVELR